ncbi:hypothetical protein, partial [Bacillus amyloliquefaciens]|uniref:hypothetical protein n=1 Tax=Bacillus amyloliquefaciens TaxID=1390 RepID=UPI0037D4BEBC
NFAALAVMEPQLLGYYLDFKEETTHVFVYISLQKIHEQVVPSEKRNFTLKQSIFLYDCTKNSLKRGTSILPLQTKSLSHFRDI